MHQNCVKHIVEWQLCRRLCFVAACWEWSSECCSIYSLWVYPWILVYPWTTWSHFSFFFFFFFSLFLQKYDWKSLPNTFKVNYRRDSRWDNVRNDEMESEKEKIIEKTKELMREKHNEKKDLKSDCHEKQGWCGCVCAFSCRKHDWTRLGKRKSKRIKMKKTKTNWRKWRNRKASVSESKNDKKTCENVGFEWSRIENGK